MSDRFLLRFDGGDAARHSMDMALLGRSLVGVDQAIHRGLWACAHPDIKRGRKRLDVTVQVTAPQAACVEVGGMLTGAMGVLPFVYEVATSLGTDYIKHLLSAVVLFHGGRKADAQAHMDKMLELFGEAQRLSFADRQSERATLERMHDRSLSAVQEVVATMQQQAREIVAPVGKSTEVLKIGGSSMVDATVIDAAIADAVRSGGSVEVGDMDVFEVKFDGLTRHNRNAKVELVDDPGRYLAADIRDPLFDEFPNAYTEAFGAASSMAVMAKPTYKDGILVKLHIMDLA